MPFTPSTRRPLSLALAGLIGTCLAATVTLSHADPAAVPTTPPAASTPGTPGAGVVSRSARQEERIEQGLKSGALTTREAARLQRQQARIDRSESRALKDGQLTPEERARLTREQNEAIRTIHAEKHDDQTGQPASASSQRMQADVAASARQQARVAQGLRAGSLTGQEAGRLERGQARLAGTEARAGADGHVGAAEQARIRQRAEHQSRRIHREKHDARHRHQPA